MQLLLARHLSRLLRKRPSKRRPHSLLSFITRANCEPCWTTSRAMHLSVFGPGTNSTPVQQRCPHSRGEYSALISLSLFLPQVRWTRFCNGQHYAAFLRWIIHDTSQHTFYHWRKIIFSFGPIIWSVWVLLGFPQKHIHGNKASTLVELRLRKWTSHFESTRALGMSMQDSPFWTPAPVLKSINMPKVLRSYSN